MLPLLRPEFRPQLRSEPDLDAAAEHWLWLFDRSPHTAGAGAEHRTAVRLYGFPRFAADDLRAKLAARLRGFDITAPEPDWIHAAGPAVDFDDAAEPGLCAPNLRGEPFDGLYCELRLTATATDRRGKLKSQSTLVLAGELTPHGFRESTAWREGEGSILNDAMTGAPWPDYDAWRESLADHRQGDAGEYEAKPLAERCFPLAVTDRQTNALVWMLTLPPFGQPRLKPALVRFLVNGLVAAAGIALAWVLPLDGGFGIATRCGLAFTAAVPLAFLLFRLAAEWGMAKHFGTGMFRRLYSDTVTLAPLTEAAAREFFDNPTARKFIAEYEAAGCRPMGDAVIEPHMSDSGAVRVYAAADGVTYVCLTSVIRVRGPDGGVKHEMWPAQVTPLMITRFPGDGRAGTTTDPAGVFRRKLSPNTAQLWVRRGVTDPAELLKGHAEIVAWYSEKFKAAPLPVQAFEPFLKWQEAVSEEERENYSRNPVTWSDGLVLLMGYTRKAYRPKGEPGA